MRIFKKQLTKQIVYVIIIQNVEAYLGSQGNLNIMRFSSYPEMEDGFKSILG